MQKGLAVMKCNVAIGWMHEYLDDDLPREDKIKLNEHLLACPECRKRFDELKRTEAFVHATLSDSADIMYNANTGHAETASAALTNRIIQQLPAKKRKPAWSRFVRNHPAVTVAVIFSLIMMTSFLAMWEEDSELIVRGTDLQNVVIAGNTVTVPAGIRINGDLTVENGTAEIHGEVKGNLTVIDGSLQLASTAKIIGENREINQALDWLWYKMTKTVSGLAYGE
ncbi:zf-HC2 domain-containing protein [Paenibacillus tarimensis]